MQKLQLILKDLINFTSEIPNGQKKFSAFLSTNLYEIAKTAKSCEPSQTGENQAKFTKKIILLWKKNQTLTENITYPF